MLRWVACLLGAARWQHVACSLGLGRLEVDGVGEHVFLRFEILQRAKGIKSVILTVDNQGCWRLEMLRQRYLDFGQRYLCTLLLNRLKGRRAQRDDLTKCLLLLLHNSRVSLLSLQNFSWLVLNTEQRNCLCFLHFGWTAHFLRLCSFPLRLWQYFVFLGGRSGTDNRLWLLSIRRLLDLVTAQLLRLSNGATLLLRFRGGLWLRCFLLCGLLVLLLLFLVWLLLLDLLVASGRLRARFLFLYPLVAFVTFQLTGGDTSLFLSVLLLRLF